MATSQDFVNWVCGDDLDYRFLKYVLLAEGDRILSFASGTTHQTIYFPEVKAFHICLPHAAEQEKIVSILSALDDKIDLNRRMNETLETMARALFKSWFVDFDPVYAKAEGRHPAHMDADTAALFPDALDDEEKPVGWEWRPLDKIAEFLNGLALQKYPATGDDFLPVINIAELRQGITAKTGKASLDVPPNYVIHDGDVLFSWSGSLTQKIWTGGKGALNQHLFRVSSSDYPKWFHFFWVDHHLAHFQMIAASKATTMGHIQRHHLSEAPTVIPSEDVLKAADRTMRLLFNRIIHNDLENRSLAVLRDTLLPQAHVRGNTRERCGEGSGGGGVSINDRNIKRAGEYVGKCLRSRMSTDDQAFWTQNYGLIREMGAIEALLDERLHFFDRSRSQADGIVLITIIDLAWQVARTLAGLAGPDSKWAKSYLPDDVESECAPGSHDLFPAERTVIEDQTWAFNVHSAMRHPEELFKFTWLLDDPWPQEMSDRLSRAGRGASAIFSAVSFTSAGWVSEKPRKQEMLALAATEWNARKKRANA